MPKERGRYKRYFHDEQINIPKTTIHSQTRNNHHSDNSSHENADFLDLMGHEGLSANNYKFGQR
jgi:hypothetical protein